MAIETATLTFAAPPKSGCRYVHGILAEAGPVRHGNLHTPLRVPGKRSLSIVRHPADWLRSWFTNINCPVGHEPVDRFLSYSRGEAEPTNEGLRAFLLRYLAGPAGWIGEMFASYQADITCRIEDMPGPLEALLGRQTTYRERGESRLRLTVPWDLWESIRQHESEFVSKWGY